MDDKWGHRPVPEDELLANFTEIPTVAATVAATDPDDVRRAMLALAAQAVEAGADPDELAEAVRAIDPHTWGTAKNRNRVY